jgi:hypothetical protein
MLEKIVIGIGIGVIALFIFAAISVVAAIPTYFLWNWLMPTIFKLTAITFWQAWGINFLAMILFKSTNNSSK